MFRIISINPERCSILHEVRGVDNALYAIMQEITMTDKRIALITGANQGVGLQVAKELVEHGYIVLVGSRNLEKGEIAAKGIGSDAQAIQIDVTDQASITAAANA